MRGPPTIPVHAQKSFNKDALYRAVSQSVSQTFPLGFGPLNRRAYNHRRHFLLQRLTANLVMDTALTSTVALT